MFDDRSFTSFEQKTVEETFNYFRKYVQPNLRHYGQLVRSRCESKNSQIELPMHVAKHIRRKVTLPFNTWVAVGGDNRGYKKYVHLQLGINHEYIFFVIALIDHPRYEKEIMNHWKENKKYFEELPEDFVFIFNHTELPYTFINQMNLKDIWSRGQNKEKCDSMIGRVLLREELVSMDSEAFQIWLFETLDILYPIFNQSLQIEQINKKNNIPS